MLVGNYHSGNSKKSAGASALDPIPHPPPPKPGSSGEVTQAMVGASATVVTVQAKGY